jgi:threonine synthase
MIHSGSKVVIVSTATGLKFTDSAAAKLQKSIITTDDCKTETVANILKISA